MTTDLVLGSFQDTEGPAAVNLQGEPTGERLPLDRLADVVKTQKNTVIEEPRMDLSRCDTEDGVQNDPEKSCTGRFLSRKCRSRCEIGRTNSALRGIESKRRRWVGVDNV